MAAPTSDRKKTVQLFHSSQWLQDIDLIIDHHPFLSELQGKRIFITGTTGLVCSAIAFVLLRYNELHHANIKLIAGCRNHGKYIRTFGDYGDRNGMSYMYYDALEPVFPEQDVVFDYIIHGASIADPSVMVRNPVETLFANVTGTHALMQAAKRCGTKRFLYISSSEVYGSKTDGAPFREDDYGSVNLLNPRSAYSSGKRAAETLCASFKEEYALDTLIVRPGHIYGPTASLQDQRVSSAFAYAAASGQDIEMKSDGSQLRSYCYCLDCAAAILHLLIKGTGGEAYNIANASSVISIKEMAQYIASAGNVRLNFSAATADEKKQFNPMNNSSLDSTRLYESGWRECFSPETGLFHTVSILRECLERPTADEQI